MPDFGTRTVTIGKVFGRAIKVGRPQVRQVRCEWWVDYPDLDGGAMKQAVIDAISKALLEAAAAAGVASFLASPALMWPVFKETLLARLKGSALAGAVIDELMKKLDWRIDQHREGWTDI